MTSAENSLWDSLDRIVIDEDEIKLITVGDWASELSHAGRRHKNPFQIHKSVDEEAWEYLNARSTASQPRHIAVRISIHVHTGHGVQIIFIRNSLVHNVALVASSGDGELTSNALST